MVEKEGRQASHQIASRAAKYNTAPEHRKGYFYLLLASIWPTTKGCRRWARKGVERRLRAFEESQNCAAIVHSFPQGNARERTVCDS